MNVFRSVLDYIRPKPQPTDADNRPVAKPFLDLSDGEIQQLLDLRKLPEWDVFLLALDRQSSLYGEAMLAATDDRDMVRGQGMILGLRRAALLLEEAKFDAEERKRTDDRRRSNEQLRREQRRGQHFASPAWTVEQRTPN